MTRDHETYWAPLAEDTSLPETLDSAARARLDGVFAAADSPWSRALEELGLQWPGGPAIEWRDSQAYVNASAIAEMISAGCVSIQAGADGKPVYSSRTRVTRLPALLKSQWRIDAYLERVLAPNAPQGVGSVDERLRESLQLGIALQALMLRLPQHEPRELAEWLAGGARKPPAAARRSVETLQRIQALRTRLSGVWTELFGAGSGAPAAPAADQAHATSAPITASPDPATWSGLPVQAGRVSGRAWLVDLRAPEPAPPEPFVAVFAQARPQAVEHYAGAAGLVFGEGGVLSHACAVAREQAIPAVTGAGRSLIAALRARPDAWITLDGSTGEVSLGTGPG